MTEILLIRHGETAWNAVKRLQGHLDIPLNAEGRRQAKALAAALQNEKLDAIIASDLQRAVQTAGEIARLQGLSTRTDPGLRERCFGGFEGELYSELPHKYPEEHAAWRAHDPDAEFPPGENAGETIRRFHQRVMEHILHYARQFDGKKIAIVAHGGVLECAYRAAKQLPLDAPREVTIYNASINRFIYQDGQISILQWGDIAHLDAADALDEINQTQT
ncbi:histidine phosphatase family protein [Undibacterium sp. CY7W]|uniref:Histidine phosphatase family protein n=1 Tax=Undibacterium rugosum TaxID=2762291 RepID=A0A923KYZ1_9BURK|nr:histidine phosphatase family protein [Undibacterium rugosum]MBC3935225.1 histidine phosphatase family protein [Undibacterium rugosum]